MKVLVIGSGVIGSIYGSILQSADHEIVHLVRQGKRDRFPDGIRLDLIDGRKGGKNGLRNYPIRLVDEIPEGDAYDAAIFPTKPYQLVEAIKDYSGALSTVPKLLLTQVWPDTSPIDRVLPEKNYVLGDAKAGGYFRETNLLTAAVFDSIDFGGIADASASALSTFRELFQSAGIRVMEQENILHYILVQYAINAGLWPPLVRAGGLDLLLRDRNTGMASLEAVRECLAVAAALGVDLKRYPDAAPYLGNSRIGKYFFGIVLRIVFRFNESVRRSSAHALDDSREIIDSYDHLSESARLAGVKTPVMESFRSGIEGLRAKV
jgi:2-dehydropantoate 2-reductase